MVPFAFPRPPALWFRGKRYRIRDDFRRVLTCYDVLQDAAFSDVEKVNLCLEILAAPTFRIRKLPPEGRLRLFQQVFSLFVENGGAAKETAEKAFDMYGDAGSIYAAFRQVYGMDLHRVRRLRWWNFSQLLANLPDGTRFTDIVAIRTRPMPKATKYNAEERRTLAMLKARYRVKTSEEERERNLAQGLKKLAHALKSAAESQKEPDKARR